MTHWHSLPNLAIHGCNRPAGPGACHITEQYTNNPIEAEHGRLKARLRPMRGLKQLRSARVISTGHAFVQNLRRGHYELGVDADPSHRLPAAFVELALAI
jgi:transposase-like protein